MNLVMVFFNGNPQYKIQKSLKIMLSIIAIKAGFTCRYVCISYIFYYGKVK